MSVLVIDVEIVYRNAALVREQQSWEFESDIRNVGSWDCVVCVCVCVGVNVCVGCICLCGYFCGYIYVRSYLFLWVFLCECVWVLLMVCSFNGHKRANGFVF